MYDEVLLIKMPSKLKEEIKERAKENYQTSSDYVRNLIIKDLKKGKK